MRQSRKQARLNQKYRQLRFRQLLWPVAIAELLLQGTAIRSILHRGIFKRGNKWLWLPLTFVQPIGPLLYFRYGRGTRSNQTKIKTK
ncbi:hypothetical protein [Loigolactobacillus bifermentans]|jgi:hypothetical protein|uniref:Cardiolipin synthase N-terminal domain-containing protein n=1 Tax=Loigolactobacillus bifermentans DSM 20003 TaxID=1423726 RepID=A0A0R1GGN0_9LACO|nr:hypothetical protein [Loigolactobacillus bifermentans]KRK33168.1 hypothetical protein FC07_GL001423 [Loigolactobacillus bifermentans DSM 20003]QGG60520.1 hypothetical protein LB003_08610 [Loigolactobacillus bifermentans]